MCVYMCLHRVGPDLGSTPSVMLAVAPAVAMNEASSLSWYFWSEIGLNKIFCVCGLLCTIQYYSVRAHSG